MTSRDPHTYTDLAQARIQHIQLHIRVDFPEHILHVRADYRLDRPVSGEFFLDTRGLDILSVMADGRSLPFELDMDDTILGRRLVLRGLQAASRFSIECTTSEHASALQWLTPAQTAGGKHPYLYSQCYSLHARSLFPCQDTPGVRFTYEAQVEVEEPLVAVMAAENLGVTRADGVCTCRFRMPQPIPSYLFAIAAGDIAFQELGPRTGVYAEPDLLAAAAWEFAENEAKIQRAEQLFGPYRWDRYDILILPPSFPYGGMENPRLTFLSPVFILGTRRMTRIVTHELAHAWTGNLVTNATWEDFWLNEGWTTYAEKRISEVLDGADFTHMDIINDYNTMLEDMEIFGTDARETCLKFSMQGLNPDEVISMIPYVKGHLFLVALERAVGREAFDPFIRRYIEAHNFQSLTTEGFVAFLQANLPAAMQQVDVEAWLYQPGLPGDVPSFHSSLYDQVRSGLQAYQQGNRPTPEQVAAWIPDQVAGFLAGLPAAVPAEDCRYFGQLFKVGERRDSDIHYLYYCRAIHSGCREVWPDVEAYLHRVGRGSYVIPLFRALLKADWSASLARPLFERVRQRYHPIVAGRVSTLLEQAGR